MIFESGETAHGFIVRRAWGILLYMSLESWVQQGYNTILGTDEHPPRDSDLVWNWDIPRKNYTAGLTSFS